MLDSDSMVRVDPCCRVAISAVLRYTGQPKLGLAVGARTLGLDALHGRISGQVPPSRCTRYTSVQGTARDPLPSRRGGRARYLVDKNLKHIARALHPFTNPGKRVQDIIAILHLQKA
jgi:hypothetical protein